MNDLREAVRDQYAKMATQSDDNCCASTNCCATATPTRAQSCPSDPNATGYSQQQLSSLPDGGDLTLGSGNPTAVASLKPGQTVLDLGSGGGIDCFLAAKQVGPTGKVIGVDMTGPMIDRARKAAKHAKIENVEFRLGEIEHLPVADSSADVILSNCVVNLSPDKPAVFAEAFRVLKPGGKLAISDIVATKPLSQEVRRDIKLYVGCAAGAVTIEQLKSMLSAADFEQVRITVNPESRKSIAKLFPKTKLEDYLVSAIIEGYRP